MKKDNNLNATNDVQSGESTLNEDTQKNVGVSTQIEESAAIAIVREDATSDPLAQAYLNYELVAELEEDGWHVAYISSEVGQLGGGAPAYIIDTQTGAILKKYYQR